VLLIFEIVTGRVVSGIKTNIAEVQCRLVNTGTFIGKKTAAVVLTLTLLIFWPMLLMGAIKKTGKTK